MTASQPPEPGERVGAYHPARTARLTVRGPDPAVVEALLRVSALSAAVSDALDALGYRLAVPASRIGPLHDGGPAVGRAITLRYLPLRTVTAGSDAVGRLAHYTLFDLAMPGDVAVIAVDTGAAGSLLGGAAVAAAVAAGLAAIVVDGPVRDIDEIRSHGLPVWSAMRTPQTGRGRVEAVEINGRITVGEVQVIPGDVVVADASGVVFVPPDAFPEVAARILRLASGTPHGRRPR